MRANGTTVPGDNRRRSPDWHSMGDEIVGWVGNRHLAAGRSMDPALLPEHRLGDRSVALVHGRLDLATRMGRAIARDRVRVSHRPALGTRRSEIPGERPRGRLRAVRQPRRAAEPIRVRQRDASVTAHTHAVRGARPLAVDSVAPGSR